MVLHPKFSLRKKKKKMGKNTHTPLCWLNISHKCALISSGMSFVIKYTCTLLKMISQPVYVSLMEQKMLNIPPNLISILKYNWKVAEFEYR